MVNERPGSKIGKKPRAVLLSSPITDELVSYDDNPQAPRTAGDIFLKQKTL
jgi:hypothetical protein